MKAILLAAGLIISGFALAAPASAAPARDLNTSAAPSAGLLVQYDRDNRHNNRRYDRRKRHHNFVPGHRYRSAPHGWRRYHSRPGDWRTRGCILVGPIWFCP